MRSAPANTMLSRLNTPRVLRAARFAIIVALAVASVHALQTCGGSSDSANFTEPVSYTLPVKGMHCDGCETTICEKVGKIAGVKACKASHTAEVVEVIAPIEQKDAIAAAIKKLGYKLE